MAEVEKFTSTTITPVVSTEYSTVTPTYVVIFEGILDGWTLSEGQLSLNVTSILSQWAQRTLAQHSPSCRWKTFKGDECKYTGSETWCDRSYSRCDALSNTDNFGGFRWLPSIVDVEIWWGRVPTT